jgi:hypothetical protein
MNLYDSCYLSQTGKLAQGIETGNVQSGGTERRTYGVDSPTRLAKRSF